MNTCTCGQDFRTVQALRGHQRIKHHTGEHSAVQASAGPALHPAQASAGPALHPAQASAGPALHPAQASAGPSTDLAALAQHLDEHLDQRFARLAELLESSAEPMCQDQHCPACSATGPHDAYQRGGADMMSWYEGIPGVAKLREHTQLMRTTLKVVG